MDYVELIWLPVVVPVAIWAAKKMITKAGDTIAKYKDIPKLIQSLVAAQTDTLRQTKQLNACVQAVSENTKLTAQSLELLRDDLFDHKNHTNEKIIELSERLAVIQSARGKCGNNKPD